MVNRVSFFSLLFLLMRPRPAHAAGVDGLLLVPASWVIALSFSVASIYMVPNRTIMLWLHFCSGVIYFLGCFFLFHSPDGFNFLVAYPLCSTFFLFILAMLLRNAAKQ